MSEQQADHQYTAGKTAKKVSAPTRKGMFQGRRCFICNETLQGNTCQLAKAITKFSSTPFSASLNDVMGPTFEVTVNKNDKSCQRCASLIQQRDKLALDLEGVNKALRGFLTRKYTLMSITSKHGNSSDIDPNCIRQVSKPVTQTEHPAGVKFGMWTAGGTPEATKPTGKSPRGQVKSSGRAKKGQKTMQLYQCVECHSSTTDLAELKSHVCSKSVNIIVSKPITIEDKSTPTATSSKVGALKILHPVTPETKPQQQQTLEESCICRFCDLEFANKADLISHSREHITEETQLLQCKICSEVFALKEELDEHEKIHELVKCTSCLETFSTVDNLAAHLTPTLKINTNFCKNCSTSFPTKEDFGNHVAIIHQNEGEPNLEPLMSMKLTYVCTCCQSELEDYKDFARHKDEHIAESIAQSKESVQTELKSEIVEETEHDYAMEINQPSTSTTTSERENKENNTETNRGPKKAVFECGMCSYRADTVETLMEHFKTHKSTKILCKHCHIQLPTVNALSKHLQYHTQPGQGVECQICTPTVTLKSKDMLMRHMADLHKLKHHCQFCGEQFRFQKELVTHQNQHPESKKYGCVKCGMRFLQVTQLQRHIELQHRDPKCRICNKVIRNPVKLRQHEARHRNEKYSCTKCERIFKTPSGLKNHMAVHTGEYKYRCDTCERGFMNRNIFIEHTNNHLENPKPLYKCNICGKNFFYQGSLWIHKKWHNNPYPYECKLCGKKLRHASVLQVHMRKHRGERPYKCPYCPMTFNSASTFKRHLMLHTGEYTYKCEDCNKGFTGKNKYFMHRHSIHGDPLPKKPIMTAMDFKVNVPVQHAEPLNAHPTAYIVENMSTESGNEDENGPRVVEVVINEEQRAVSSITLLGEPLRWTEASTSTQS